MGLIKAVTSAISGTLADEWLEVYEPNDMGDQTVFTGGILTRRGENTKGTDNTVSNGSTIHVYDNQFMMLVDGGKIVDYTAEPGYYTVSNSTMPSFFNGEFKDSLKDSLNRMKFGGQTPTNQKVFFINLQEIKGIKFGTRTPVNYFDNFYNAELFLRAHGSYSIKITDPLRFYAEAVPRNAESVEISDINEQYLAEFLEAFQSAINQMSADGIRISHVTAKSRELGNYMATTLDEDWRQMRGMEIQAVGVASVSYDDESKALINMRNEGAMLSDPTVREGYMQGHVARGLEAAGSNEGGAMNGFLGMGMGMNMGGGFMGTASQTNMQQMQMNQQAGQSAQAIQPQQPAQAPVSGGWICGCGKENGGKFCSDCGSPAPAPKAAWKCSCGVENTGKFCPECGSPAPAAEWTCKCGVVNKGKFCAECGTPRE